MGKKAEENPKAKAAVKPAEAAAPAPEAKVEKKKEKKSQKERPKSKKKHTKVKVWKLYKIEGDKVLRKNQICPRCGAGTFLASYKNRTYCGKCGWSKINQ